jgi:hypothetical protein
LGTIEGASASKGAARDNPSPEGGAEDDPAPKGGTEDDPAPKGPSLVPLRSPPCMFTLDFHLW